MSTAVSTSSFEGSDVDGLDKVAQDCNEAAQVVATVKTVCEAIVAAASIFGPFGAAFVAYLKTVVIPWLTKIEEALQLFSKVLSARSSAQRDASSTATSLPTYTTPSNLPTQSTANYPTMPLQTGSIGSGASGAGGTATVGGTTGTGASTLTQPPSIGATPGTTGSRTGTGAGSALPTTPFAQDVAALTGLVKAIDHLIHPGSDTPTDPTTATGTGTGADPTTPIATTPIGGATDPTGGAGTGLGTLGGASISPTGTAGNGDVLGTLQVPVEISPDGTITPLLHAGDAGLGTTGSIGGTGTVPTDSSATLTSHAMPAVTSGLSHHAMTAATISHSPAALGGHSSDAGLGSGGTGSGSGTSGGGTSGGGGSLGGGAQPTQVSHPYTHTMPTSETAAVHHATTTATSAAHPAPAQAAPAHATGAHATSSNHDGLYSGLGQAAGLGAGAGAIAKASLNEARERAENGVLGAAALPFDADSDAAARSSVFDNALNR